MQIIDSPKKILKEVYGYSAFRGDQESIIQNTMDGKDSLVLMPTGAGKSLCFQIPALCLEGTAIVISPLISLMQNQVMTLKSFGIKAEFINSSLTQEELVAIVKDIKNLKLLYISPERFQMEGFRNWLKGLNISFFAVDEAHCVSRWGHDFRPDYIKLSSIKEEFDKPIIALTATADIKTRIDIPLQLRMPKYELIIADFDRPNIKILVEEKNNTKTQLLNFLGKFKSQSGIVYCLSRKKVDETTEFLKKQGYDALAYHAGMSAEDRKNNQDYFILNEGVIVVATIAFGMGIDKPDVRFVVHLDMPQNLESYYQEIGRAGRDGDPCVALLLYSLQDFALRNQMIFRSNNTQKMSELNKLNEMLCFAETLVCKRNYLMEYFDNPHVKCGNCESCLNQSETLDMTHIAKDIISLIESTKSFFGITYLTLILRGSNSKNLREIHKTHPLFGKYKDVSDALVKKTFRQMLVSKNIKIDTESDYNNLIILNKDVVKVEIKKDHFEIQEDSSEISDKTDLLSRLKELRTKIAHDNGIPPYLVLHDKSLKEMVKKKPKNMSSLKKVHGWGDIKLKKYGDLFLKLLNS